MTGSVLVTGGAGYIGSHAVLALLDAGYRVVVIDDLTTGFAWAVDPRATLVVGRIEDEPLVRDTMRAQAVFAVMHFAGSIIVPESVSDPLKYYRNNTVASRSLIESAVVSGVRHFIFSSTAAVYGIPDAVPVTEDTPRRPINPYGMSKLMTEAMLADVAAAHPINYAALRYFNVAGADPKGRSGQSTPNATHLIKVAGQAALGQRDGLTVFGTDYDTVDGTCVRDYIHVSDLALAHVAAAQRLQEGLPTEPVYNLGSGAGTSVREIMTAIRDVTESDFEPQIMPRRPGDPARIVAAGDLAARDLGWSMRHSLEDMVSSAWTARRRAGDAYPRS